MIDYWYIILNKTLEKVELSISLFIGGIFVELPITHTIYTNPTYAAYLCSLPITQTLLMQPYLAIAYYWMKLWRLSVYVKYNKNIQYRTKKNNLT